MIFSIVAMIFLIDITVTNPKTALIRLYLFLLSFLVFTVSFLIISPFKIIIIVPIIIVWFYTRWILKEIRKERV